MLPRLLLLIGLLLATASHPAHSQSQTELSLEIIPHHYPDSNSQLASINLAPESPHFHVLLTNNSSRPINIFEEWNSWGYFGLSFEITYPDGRKVMMSKANRGWDKNFESTTTIVPHGHYLFEINFQQPTNKTFGWNNSPLKGKTSTTECRLRAIYSIENSKEAQEKKAWTGTISSAEGAYSIWHYVKQ